MSQAYRCSCGERVGVVGVTAHIRRHLADPDWDGRLVLRRENEQPELPVDPLVRRDSREDTSYTAKVTDNFSPEGAGHGRCARS